ncbi:MAG: FapA family protein, partial [bacterium]
IVEEGVEKAYLQSEQNVLIQSGVRGKGGAQINAGGSIMADFIEQAGLISQKNVVVSEMIMHSRVDAGEGVYVTGERGLIAGGEIRAGLRVFAREIGSIGASDTNIEVGIDPKFFRSVAKIEEQIADEREQLDKVERAINTMASKENRSEEEDKKYAKLKETKESLERNIENHREEQKNLSRRADEREGAEIMCEGTIFGGTRIGIGNDIYRVRSGKKEHCGFKKINDKVQQVNYEKPLIPSL